MKRRDDGRAAARPRSAGVRPAACPAFPSPCHHPSATHPFEPRIGGLQRTAEKTVSWFRRGGAGALWALPAPTHDVAQLLCNAHQGAITH
jgi:hypothetical protein